MKTSRALLWAAAGVTAAAALGLSLWPGNAPDRAARRRGAALAAALRAGIHATASARAPHRCARLDPGEIRASGESPPAGAPGGRRLLRQGPELRVEPPDASLTLGVVADGHGALDALPRVRRAFAAAGVELVVSLGGMGRDRETIERALGALAAEEGAAGETGAWLLLAMPGDWEPIPEHRAAVAALAHRGVMDGSRVRFVDMDGVYLATLPGAPHRSRLMAGNDGCVYTPGDAAALVAALAAHAGARVLLAHAPPRQAPAGPTPGDGPAPARPTDTGRTEISIGERPLAEALSATPVDVVIHGLVAPGPARRRAARLAHGRAPVFLAAGVLDPLARLVADPGGMAGGAGPGAVAGIALVTAGRVTWQPVTPGAPEAPPGRGR